MFEEQPATILCLASYFKGVTFLKACSAQGGRVLLLTREGVAHEPWPRDQLEDLFSMPDLRKRPDIIYAVSYLMRARDIARIVPLDDYDVETAASLREHLRSPGMGESTARYFRDKLAMRMQARAAGIPVPAFTPVFDYERLAEFMRRVSPPWVLKPRSEAGAMGIKKVHNAEEVWRWLDRLGDEQSYFLLEQFVPGEVYHVDSIVWDGQVQFAAPHKYAQPPMSVAHEGGVFISRTLPRTGEESEQILALNRQLLAAFQLGYGVSHTEFIRGRDGRFYFLETAARVGGANIEQLVEAATGVNLWAEWARLELALAQGRPYSAPPDAGNFASVLICLARQEHPDLTAYREPEIVYRLDKPYHAGVVVAAEAPARVEQLIATFAPRFAHDFLAVAPPLDKPPA